MISLVAFVPENVSLFRRNAPITSDFSSEVIHSRSLRLLSSSAGCNEDAYPSIPQLPDVFSDEIVMNVFELFRKILVYLIVYPESSNEWNISDG